MRRIGILIFILFCAFANAQTYAPIGSIWHYTQYNPFKSTAITYKTIESIADTNIYGITCKKLLEVERYYDDTILSFYRYMYTSNDSVFFLADSAFHLLYSFNAAAGDTLTLDYFLTANGSPLEMIIDSTDVININGIERKIQYISCGDGILVEFGDQVIEGIGSTYFMFPVYDGSPNGPLRCYMDSTICLFLSPFHPAYGWNHIDCDDIITNIEQPLPKQDILVYPNPASDNIHIEFREDATGWYSDRSLEMYNVTGERMLFGQIPFRSRSFDCNVASLPPGIYFLRIRERQSVLFSGKVVIAR